MEKIKLGRLNRKTGKEEEFEIFDSISPKRLEFESKEEYVIRRKFIKELEKKKKNTRNYIHVSTTLIPLKNEKGEVVIMNGKPLWVDRTNGVTYIKNKENE
jgi:hypothetical protein